MLIRLLATLAVALTLGSSTPMGLGVPSGAHADSPRRPAAKVQERRSKAQTEKKTKAEKAIKPNAAAKKPTLRPKTATSQNLRSRPKVTSAQVRKAGASLRSIAKTKPDLRLHPQSSGAYVSHNGVFKNKKITIPKDRSNYILNGIKTTLPNGKVRYDGGHRHGTGFAGKSEFPKNWSDRKIMSAIRSVANNKVLPMQSNGGKYRKTGVVDGVRIRVVLTAKGSVHSAYPTNTPRNPK